MKQENVLDQNQARVPLRLVSVAEDVIPLENQKVLQKFIASLESMTSYLNRSRIPSEDFSPLPRRQPDSRVL